ncbi:MAG: hypothetical protein KatS3mg116_0022 [Elioraea sp.]|nr:MAG: hypothetical protein KatS3mg116_0022 [Elioraea sp.]
MAATLRVPSCGQVREEEPVTRPLLALPILVAAAAAEAQPQDGAVADLLRRAGVAPTAQAVAGSDPKSRALVLDSIERTYPLPRAVLDREGTPPPDADAIMDRLGLVRRPGVPVADLTGHAPTRQEIVDALAGR